jgi:hypothetical protein
MVEESRRMGGREEEEREHLHSVHRRLARSGAVSFAEDVPLRETKRSKIILRRWFVPLPEGGSRLAIRLDRYGPSDAGTEPEATISLSPKEVQAFLHLLGEGLAVAGQPDDGKYLVLRLDGNNPAGDSEPRTVAQAVARLLAHPKLAEHLQAADLDDELVAALGPAVRLRHLRAAVEELRRLLESGAADERIYQRWSEQHSWVFGSAWRGLDRIRHIAVGDSVDGLLPDTSTGLRDILELKRPDQEPLKWDDSHRNYYWAVPVASAIGQCHRYLDKLHEVGRWGGGLEDNPEIVAYHPRALIVIGRSVHWENRKFHALHGLNSRLHGITVITYDQLLWQGEQALSVLESGADTVRDGRSSMREGPLSEEEPPWPNEPLPEDASDPPPLVDDQSHLEGEPPF